MYQAIAWEARDADEGYTITIYGRTQEGYSVSVTTLFKPYFFVQVPKFETPESLAVQLHVKCIAVPGKTLWGFTNNELLRFLKCEFSTLADLRNCVWKARRLKLRVFESNIDPLLRFLHRTGIQSAGWFTIKGKFESDFSTTCKHKYFVPNWTDIKCVECDFLAQFRIMSLDIESYSKSKSFPDADNVDDTLFQIAMTTKVYGTDIIHQKCLSLGTASNADCFKTERELLDAFTEYIHTIDPDVITGWNIFGFDLEYIYKRMIICKCDPATFYLGRRRDIACDIVYKNLASGALGSNVLKMVPMIGRYVFDLFQTIKSEHNLDSYSLNNVSLKFLGDSKIDMPIHEMFRRYESGEDLTEVAEYCIKDTELPIKIMDKLCTFENLVEMAKATWVPLSFLSERGQQIKVFSQIAKKARELNFFIPTIFEKPEAQKFEGATVLDAQCGAYYTPITALDFEGLYPSIMIAHNLCYSTLVMDERYLGIPGVTYETYGDCVFAQNVQSLLPEILKDLKLFRKKAKQDMKNAKGTPLYNVYNGKQLAYKISMNSVYGFTGAGKGILPCVDIAATVTRRGRQMIQESKDYVEEHFPGAKVRYGDSVMPGTPVLTKQGPVTIESLGGDDWVNYHGFLKDGSNKEQCELDVDVWTHIGWKRAKRVIRHKCNKKIYRVLTHTGLVDVTEDHSLLGPKLELLKPGEIEIGTELLHSFPPIIGCGNMRDEVYTKNQLEAQIEYSNIISSGYHARLSINDENVIKVTPFINASDNTVKKLHVLHESYDGYVYDIETDAGTFQAGVGQMIVKNTDSIMVEFDTEGRKDQEAIDYSWVLGERAAKEITALFKKPNNLELEKVYCPYFLYSKKRYAAKKWIGPTPCTFDEIDIKGLQVIRRDNCAYVREVCKNLIDMILDSSDPQKPLQYIEDSKKALGGGNVPMDKLVLSKRLGSAYKNENLAHVVVRNKMRERAPGSEPRSGDRVQFVLVEGGKKMYEKAEDPTWVIEHDLKIDYAYYIKHQFENPVKDLIEPLVT